MKEAALTYGVSERLDYWAGGKYFPFNSWSPFSGDAIDYRDKDPSLGLVGHEEKHNEQAGGFFGRVYFAMVWWKRTPLYRLCWRQRVTWEVEATAIQIDLDGVSVEDHAMRISSRYSSGKLSYKQCLKELKDAYAKHS